MTYFPDLSDYTYRPRDGSMLNVGWLGRAHAYAVGPVPDQVVATLTTMADEQHNIMRGLHYCDFCNEESPIVLPADVPRGFVYLGMGELPVLAPDGTYSAPSLTIHCITEHSYQPPAEFIDAVLHGQSCLLKCG